MRILSIHKAHNQPHKIITSKLEKALEITEITLEYINTGDSIAIVGKVAGNTINTWILTESMNISKTIAQ